jgi:glycerol-3-phosphate acyltransferase PlsY
MQGLLPLLAALGGYLVGSLSFAVIISRLMGLSDPRSYGSGNPGATNVLRSGNKAAAILTLLFDAQGLRAGAAGDAVRRALGPGRRHGGAGRPRGFPRPPLAGVLQVPGRQGRGHRGRRDPGAEPWLGAATLLTWIIIAAFFRYSSLAAIVSALFAPFYQLLIWGGA